MNLAQLFQSQNFALLMQALDQAGALTAGRTVPARLLSLEPDGTATAAIGDTKIALVLAGPEAKQAALQPGATLMLKLEAPEKPGGDLRATLVDIRPPAAGAAPAQAADPGAGVGDRTARTGAVEPAPGQLSPSQPSPSQASAGATPPGQATSNRPAIALATSPTGTAPSVATPPAEPAKPASAARQPVASAAAAAQGASAATPSPSRAPGQPPAEAATAPSPRLLAGPLLGAALQRQDSLAPLFANLRGLAEGSLALAMPRPVLAAVERVLAQSLPAVGPAPTGPALQAALRRSGLFSEAAPAAGRPAGPAGDLKAALQSLRATLEPVMAAFSPKPPAGAPAPSQAATTATQSPPPPRRDGPLAPQPIAERTIAPGESPFAIAATLLDQTDAALDRITLSQFASLPLDGQRPETGQQRWLAEIPLAFQTGTAILPLQIEREPPRRGVAEIAAPVWRVRFALDVEPMGPLQGIVTLQGRSVGVTLWAEREETSTMLRGAAPGLEAALLHADFGAGSVDVHTGRPQTAQPLAGQFLDRLS
ncbi:flagellar hook-length control protein FliK [Bosea sp. (in: a-proteobacteria)]|uniref:flagellar hook-length control protein FliK n=1 Tax=Bosea sp. (in: a-proteobacteria) TaxID=1871050 RepID=UPI003B3BCE93